MRALWTSTFLSPTSAWVRLARAISTWDELAPTVWVADCRADRAFSTSSTKGR